MPLSYNGTPDNLLAYPGASVKYTRDMDGVLRYRPHNLITHSKRIAATGWAVVGATPTQDQTDPNGGTKATLLVGTGGWYIGNTVAALVGAAYKIIVRAKTTSGTSAFRLYANGATLKASSNLTATTTWQEFAFDFTADSAAESCGVADSSTGAGGTVVVAFIQVRRANAVASYVETDGAVKIGLPYEWGPTNLFANPTSPATQTITGLTVGRKYTVYCEGAGSIALSGAGNGTATAASPRTFKAASTSLVCTVSGSLSVVHVREAYGIRQESARTNLRLRSSQFDNASWSKSGFTVTANAATAPDGTTTADALFEVAAASNPNAQQSASTTIGTLYTVSIFAKANGRNQVRLVSELSGSFAPYFTLTGAGSIAGVVGPSTATITSVGDGWYRCTFTYTATSASDNWYVATAEGNAIISSGDPAKGVYVWGAQLEVGSTASSPIETFGSTVTRAVDPGFALPTSAFPHNPNAWTIYLSAEYFNAATVQGGLGLSLAADPISESSFMYQVDATTAKGETLDGGAGQSSIVVSKTGGALKMAYSVEPNKAQFCLNGVLGVEDTSGTMPTVDQLIIGNVFSLVTGFPADGYIKEVIFLPRGSTGAQLQALTAA